MSDDVPRPVLPTVGDLNRPFWEACAAGRLELQVCNTCGHIRYPISEICPRCLDSGYTWRTMSGDATILSWALFQRAYHPAWADLVPYNLVLVQLAEGPRMFGNVVPLDRSDLEVGAPVRVAFDEAGDGIFIPRWKLT